MLSHELAAFAAQFRAWSRTGGVTLHPVACDELALMIEDLAGQARALERQPVRPPAPPALCGGVFADLLAGRARRRHADGTVVLLRRVPAIPPIPDGDDAA